MFLVQFMRAGDSWIGLFEPRMQQRADILYSRPHTNGRAATVLRPSVCRLWPMCCG